MPGILQFCRRAKWPALCLLLAFLFLDMTRAPYSAPAPTRNSGDTIQPYSIVEWESREKKIAKKRESFKGRSKRSVEELLEMRILDSVLINLSNLRNSPQKYSLFHVGDSGIGETCYFIDSDIVVFNIHPDDVGNFIHETTHGGQFQRGDIVFRQVRRKINDTSRGTGDDFQDELQAYLAQFAYDKGSVSILPNSVKEANSFEDLDTTWLLGLRRGADGPFVYMPNDSSGVVAQHIDTGSDIHMMRVVYPLAKYWFQSFDPATYRLGLDNTFINFPAKLRKITVGP